MKVHGAGVLAVIEEHLLRRDETFGKLKQMKEEELKRCVWRLRLLGIDRPDAGVLRETWSVLSQRAARC